MKPKFNLNAATAKNHINKAVVVKNLESEVNTNLEISNVSNEKCIDNNIEVNICKSPENVSKLETTLNIEPKTSQSPNDVNITNHCGLNEPSLGNPVIGDKPLEVKKSQKPFQPKFNIKGIGKKTTIAPIKIQSDTIGLVDNNDIDRNINCESVCKSVVMESNIKEINTKSQVESQPIIDSNLEEDANQGINPGMHVEFNVEANNLNINNLEPKEQTKTIENDSEISINQSIPSSNANKLSNQPDNPKTISKGFLKSKINFKKAQAKEAPKIIPIIDDSLKPRERVEVDSETNILKEVTSDLVDKNDETVMNENNQSLCLSNANVSEDVPIMEPIEMMDYKIISPSNTPVKDVNDVAVEEVVIKSKFNIKNAISKLKSPPPCANKDLNSVDMTSTNNVRDIRSPIRQASMRKISSTESQSSINLETSLARHVNSNNLSHSTNNSPLFDETDDIMSTSSTSESVKRRKRSTFRLKYHKTISDDNTTDFSNCKLIDLINTVPFMPPPTCRINRINNRIKSKTLSISDSQSITDNQSESTNKQSPNTDSQSSQIVLPQKQFRLDLDGQIVFDEVENEACVPFDREGLEEVVENANDLKVTYRSYTKRKLSGKRWSAEESKSFLQALMMVGTNFTAMTYIIKDRSRNDLKKKFKVEEKRNYPLIHQILTNLRSWNISSLNNETPTPSPSVSKAIRKDAMKRKLRDMDSSFESTNGKKKSSKKPRRFVCDPKKVDENAEVLPDYLAVMSTII